MSAIVRVKGTVVDFPGGERVVPPLSLASVEALQDRLSSYSGGLGDVGIVIDALHHALKRNYPEVTRDEVGEMVDMGNMQQVMEAVMSVSGLQRQADAAGGATAAR